MIKQEDPNTGLSEFFIRELEDGYKIRSIKTGKKVLIDYDSLLAFLQSKNYKMACIRKKKLNNGSISYRIQVKAKDLRTGQFVAKSMCWKKPNELTAI